MWWTKAAKVALAALLCTLLAGCEFEAYYGEEPDHHHDDHHHQEGELRVTNETGSTIFELYVTPSGSDHWGPDQLAPDVLPDDETLTLTDLPEDRYDVMAVLSGGTRVVNESLPIYDHQTTWLSIGPLPSRRTAETAPSALVPASVSADGADASAEERGESGEIAGEAEVEVTAIPEDRTACDPSVPTPQATSCAGHPFLY